MKKRVRKRALSSGASGARGDARLSPRSLGSVASTGSSPIERGSRDRPAILVSGSLVLLILGVYLQTFAFEFLRACDDSEYVSHNPFVNRGLSSSSVAWAFTHFHGGNWHPLTSISHMLDCSLFGLDPGYHHLTNVLLHALNSVLLLHLLRHMTGALWRSAAVAALFALHPLHVESVAWISERKDVLSTLFALLAIEAHRRYVLDPSWKRYGATFLALSLGLMAKPMLVTLPLLLMLLDHWPLGRYRGVSSARDFARRLGRLLLEKAPLFALAVASGVITLIAQSESGTVTTIEHLPIEQRVQNAVVAYVDYLRGVVWPFELSPYYPYGIVSGWRVAGAMLVLLLASALALRSWRRAPWWITGWLWFVVTLVPVIGLVQVGAQARADRYMYIPLIGIGLMVVWGVGEVGAIRRRQRVAASAAGLVLVALALVSWKQVRHWRDDVTLFEHALAVTEDNWLVHYGLAGALAQRGRLAEARQHFVEAARINPTGPWAQIGLGYALEQEGRLDRAVAAYREAVRLMPTLVDGHVSLGNALLVLGNAAEAGGSFAEAVRLRPLSAEGHFGLGVASGLQGRIAEAAGHFAQAVRLEPEWAEAHDCLGTALLEGGEPAAAIEHFAEAVRLKPELALARAHWEAARLALARSQRSGSDD